MNPISPATRSSQPATHTVWLRLDPSRYSLAGAWLLLGLGALLISGVFACILVLSRTPILAAWLPVADWFRISLVLHVDLAVVVWLLSFAGSLWTLAGHDRGQGRGWFGWLAFGLALPGLLLLGVSPLLGARQPIMSNYLPILQHPLFFWGLFLFGGGIFLTALRLVLAPFADPTATTTSPLSRENIWRWGARCGAWVILLAMLTFLGAWRSLPTTLPDSVYFEHFFWGGGHLLQLAHTLLVMVVWLWLGQLGGLAFPWSPGWVALWFGLGLLPAGAGPVSYLVWPTVSVESRDFFTFLMSHGSWPAATLLGIGILWRWQKKPMKDHEAGRAKPKKKRMKDRDGVPGGRGEALTKNSSKKNVIKDWDGGPGGRAAPFPLAGSGAAPQLTADDIRSVRWFLGGSLGLLVLGIILGGTIRDDSVMVTAHYHATVGAVTLAYMGFTGYLLPLLGFGRFSPVWSRRQALLWTVGFLCLIVGLAWSGLHGVPRKTTLDGATHGPGLLGMTLMGTGGVIALSSLFLFLGMALRAVIMPGHRQEAS